MSLEKKEIKESLEEIEEETKEKKVISRVTAKEADSRAPVDKSKIAPEPVEVVGVKGRLLGKIALVTGAASGIGRGIAHRFAVEGAKVSVVDLNLGDAKKVVKEIKDFGGKAMAVQCDVGDEDQVTRAVEETEKNLGSVDILVNDAGIFDMAAITDISLEKWLNMFRVHVVGTFLFSKTVLKNMKSGGRIINISSLDGISGNAFLTSYASAKAAMIGFTTSLAEEIAHKGITVNAIAPAFIETPMTQMLVMAMPEFYKGIPVKRLGKPEDIAAVAAFLASPEASYITGQVIVVDGGFRLANIASAELFKMMGH